MFKPNGLLGTKAPSSKEPNDQNTGVPTFKPNGLLGSTKKSELDGDSQESGSEQGKQVPRFVTNGLLGSKTSVARDASQRLDGTPFDQLTSSELLASTQDEDELPPVFEALGIPKTMLNPPSRAHIATPVASTSTSSAFSVRASTFDGKPVTWKKRTKVSRVARDKLSSTSSERMGNLLDVPIHRLMEKLSTETAQKIQNEQPTASTSRSSEPVEDTLWVDRYRPRKFTELMGNERVARETMAWVKQWDWCVFGKNKKGKKRARDGDQNNEEQDEYHRPYERLLLLSGPPGLGKTTLAHVVAKQAGYEVMEINASDARSGSVIDDRVRPTLEAGSAVGSSKPVLLIIDEIDGATGAGENSSSFIHKLIQLTQDRPKKKNQKKDPNAKRPILRPIICICNDINASSLAKLRPKAYQIRFQRPADIHTVKRLREICELECLRADSRALTTLVGLAKGDLRGCLNTLQFIKSKHHEVTENVIRGATAGMKEADASLSSVLNDLFSPIAKKRVKELGMTEEEENRFVARLASEIDGSGREASIALGCFAHYATLRQHDANFTRYEKANEWLLTFDMLSSAMYTNGDFALSPYLSYTLVPFYPLFQERGGPKVERNQDDWDNLQTTKANEEIIKTVSNCLKGVGTGVVGSSRHLLSAPILQLEFLPLINRIICPPLRPVNSQLIKPEEKNLLNRLVDIMVSFDFRFFQERAEDGQLSYRLDPPIDVFVTYDGKRAADISVSRYAIRHLVAGEIDAKAIARDADVVEKSGTGKRPKAAFFGDKSNANQASAGGDEDVDMSPRASKRAKVAEPTQDIAEKPPTDFFGRVISVPVSGKGKPVSRKGPEKKFKISYKYAEGNSAAVRKPVKFGAFM